MVKLGVNIDHVATLRNARGGIEPNPVEAALICQKAGADGITIHLREDRRHIRDKDVYDIKEAISIPLNLEMALDPEIVEIACDVLPNMCTLVPEKREELTTEGGLDVITHLDAVKNVTSALQQKGIKVSLFIEPDFAQIDATKQTGAEYIEIHTGRYAEYEVGSVEFKAELERVVKATEYAISLGICVNAGHGLNYHNTQDIIAIEGIDEVNIGHSMISRSVFTGLSEAVTTMKSIVTGK